MPKARKTQVSIEATPYYHCISRCMPCFFLCGKDSQSGQDYEHRRLSRTLAVNAFKTAAFRRTPGRQLSHLAMVINHNSTIFRGSIDNLRSRSTLAPHTSLPWSHPGFATRLLAKL